MKPALFALLVLLTACRGTSVKLFDHTVIEGRPRSGSSVRPVVWGGGLPVRSFDPNGEEGWCDVAAAMHARLFTVDQRGRLAPDLVASWETSSDGLSWVLRLREDAHWHDGEAVRTEDVIATWNALSKVEASDVRQNLVGLAGVRSVRQVDDAVVFELSHRFPELPDLLTEMAVLPAHILKQGANSLNERPVGAGPFMLLDRSEDTFVLAPHRDWHGGVVRTPMLVIKVIEDDRRRGQALASGQIDGAHIKPESLPLLGDSRRFRIHQASSGVIRAVPIRVDAPGMGDPRVRRALSALVDRELLVKEALGGLGRPAWQLLAPGSAGFHPALDQQRLTRTGALRLLDDAGWTPGPDGMRSKGGVPFTLRLIAWQGEAFRRQSGDLIVKAWRSAGIDAQVLRVDHAGYSALAKDMAGKAEGFVGGWGGLRMPVTTLARKVRSGGGQNRGGYSNTTLDEALREAGATEQAGLRAQRVRDIQVRLDEETPWIPLVYPDYLFATRAEIDGLSFDVVDSWYEWPRHLWQARWRPTTASQRN